MLVTESYSYWLPNWKVNKGILKQKNPKCIYASKTLQWDWTSKMIQVENCFALLIWQDNWTSLDVSLYDYPALREIITYRNILKWANSWRSGYSWYVLEINWKCNKIKYQVDNANYRWKDIDSHAKSYLILTYKFVDSMMFM